MLTRLAANPAGAVHGTILTTAVTAAASARGELAGPIAAANMVTLVVFWLAHVYSSVLGQRLNGEKFRWAGLPSTMMHELAMLEAAAPSLLFLLLASAGLIGNALAIDLALANGVVQLLAWGIIAARRLGWSWPASLTAGAFDAALGIIIVMLKALLK